MAGFFAIVSLFPVKSDLSLMLIVGVESFGGNSAKNSTPVSFTAPGAFPATGAWDQ